jgi:hypothetical protein
MDNRKLVHKLLFWAFVEIRFLAYEEKNKPVFAVADLFHNIPNRLEKAQTDSDFADILDFLRMIADGKGMTGWLDNVIAQLLKEQP